MVVNCPGDGGATAVSTAEQLANPYPGNSNGSIWDPSTNGYYHLSVTGSSYITDISNFTPPTSKAININADKAGIVIKALDLNGNFAYLQVTQNLSLGSLVNTAYNSTNTLPITINNGNILTLTGAGTSIAQDGFDTNPNTYNAIGAISFESGNGILEVNSNNSGEITLNNAFLKAINGKLQVITPLTVTDSSVQNIGKINIGTASSASTLTIGADRDVFINNIIFNNANSTLSLDSTNAVGSAITFSASAVNLGGQVYDSDTGINTNVDLTGIVSLNAHNNQLTLTGASLGINPTSRLKNLKITGNASTFIYLPVYTGQLTFNNSDTTNFAGPVFLGTNGNITLLQNAKVNGFAAPGDSLTVDLGSNAITLTNSTLNLTGDTVINTKFDSASRTGGHITIGDTSNPSILNYSGANSMKITLTANSALPADNSNYQYTLFENKNGTITPLADNSKITFTANEQNRYITWSYDPNAYIISSTVDVSSLPQNVSNNGGSNAAQVITQALITSSASSNPTTKAASAQIISDLGSMTASEEVKAVEHIVPNTSSSIALTEANDISGRDISDRVLSSIPININVTEEAGVAAGDHDIITKYGAWISEFYQKAVQRIYKNNPSYKVANYGGTIGFDTMVSDHITMGLAWSYVKTDLKHHGIVGTDKGKTSSNLFSLYALTDMAHDYFVSCLAAIGFSKARNLEERRITDNSVQIAQGKYNSKIYSGKILGGKQCKLKNDKFTAIPMLGLRYTKFNDGSYQETGASTQNLSVAKKSSYNFESILGGKIVTNYTLKNNYTVTPELSAFAYVKLKNKAAVTHISNAAFTNPVTLEGAKTSKAWYSLGAAVGIAKNHIEYNLAYETQLDKKYIGHQGMLKVRVNF